MSSIPIRASSCSARRSKFVPASTWQPGFDAKSFSRWGLPQRDSAPRSRLAIQFRQRRKTPPSAIGAFRERFRMNTPGCSRAPQATPDCSPTSVTCCVLRAKSSPLNRWTRPDWTTLGRKRPACSIGGPLRSSPSAKVRRAARGLWAGIRHLRTQRRAGTFPRDRSGILDSAAAPSGLTWKPGLLSPFSATAPGPTGRAGLFARFGLPFTTPFGKRYSLPLSCDLVRGFPIQNSLVSCVVSRYN